jgi:hypothetical protein
MRAIMESTSIQPPEFAGHERKTQTDTVRDRPLLFRYAEGAASRCKTWPLFSAVAMAEPKRPDLHVNAFADPSVPPASPDDGATVIIKRAAIETAASVPVADAVEAEFGLPLPQLLGVISYCYAKGFFRSADIAERLRQDPDLKARFGRKLPDESDIRRFRRRFSGEIEDTLETLFRTQRGPEGPDTVVLHKAAAEQVHDAAWHDNNRR